jgi:hypothetical protein
MRKLSFLFALCLLIGGLSACKTGNGNGAPNNASVLILGKWNLQHQKIVKYVNGTKQTDTSFTANAGSTANLQFNKNGTYHSASYYISSAGPPFAPGGIGNIAASDSTYGNYSIQGSMLNLSSTVAGFTTGSFAYGVATTIGTLPTLSLLSNNTQINVLTANSLTIHTELIYAATVNQVSATYKNEFDFYYNR